MRYNKDAIMAKINTKQIIEYLKEAGASEEDIPVLAMTAYYESNFDTLQKIQKQTL